jgi:ureidoglycolate hydrolase
MDDALRRITPDPLSSDGWAPYGWLPVPDTDPSDGQGRLAFAWGDVHVNIISHRRDEVPESTRGLRCEVLFRHATHTQALMPLDDDAVIVVAPADSDPAQPPDPSRLRAFILPVLSAAVLHPGTWHWGPYPMTAEEVRLFNVQGFRYREDNQRVDLAAAGAAVEVVLNG